MPIQNSLHGGKPDSGSGKIRNMVQPFKYAKQLACVTHAEANAVVADEKHGQLFFGNRPEFDVRLALSHGKFPRVAQQILQH